jgi:predicted pyridoxine 5'-phosphate oxidase superfamily flavin-nucleotide-binding protein
VRSFGASKKKEPLNQQTRKKVIINKNNKMIGKEVKKYIDESVLCWLATANRQNEPNVSPKEIFTYRDDKTLLIANVGIYNVPRRTFGFRFSYNLCYVK